MLRSAAKNFPSVFAVVDPGRLWPGARRAAGRATTTSTSVDCSPRRSSRTPARTTPRSPPGSPSSAASCSRQQITVSLERAQTLRYGENPGQRAAFYVERGGGGLAALEQRGGKELSFNNLLDLEGALIATDPFAGEICCAIVKHTTPCGLAVGTSAVDAYRKALACDPASAFGSVISFTTPVDAEAAEAVSSLFVECIVAPEFSPDALEMLGRKKNLRVLVGTATLDAARARLQARARRRARTGARA